MWCSDKVWPADKEDGEPTEYIRSDLVEIARAEAHRAGMLAGLKEAQSILGSNLERYHVAPDFGGPSATCKDGWEAGFTDATVFIEAAIRARIMELDK